MAKLRKRVAEKFEYANHELSARGFRDYVKHFVKGKPCHLKKKYVKGGQQDYPMGVERNEWDILFQY
jgi:hypothetical protein